MKRRSWQSSRSTRSRSLFDSPGRVASAALIVVALVLLMLRLFAPSTLYALARPLWSAGARFIGSAGSSPLENHAALVQERDRLEAANAALVAENAALNAQAHDFQALLGDRQGPPKEIVAGVLAGPPVAPYDVLIVDQGKLDGVLEGAPAFGQGGTPIGRVGVVEAHTARIALYSAPGTLTDGWLGDNRVPVTLKGAGAGAYAATIAKDAGAAQGQSVYLGGPGALPLGTVVRVDSDPSSPTETLHIRPYANPFSLTWVTIQPAYGL